MTKNIRVSLYILIPIIFWMLSGFFFTEEKDEIIENKKLFTVSTFVSLSLIHISEPTRPY